MKKIIIELHNASREDILVLEDFLKVQCWDYRFEEPEPERKTLRNEIIELIKKNEENGGIMIEKIEEEIISPNIIIDKEIVRLLEEGIIFEPRPHKLRWLG